MFTRYYMQLLVFTAGQFFNILCYNIDTNYPIIYKDPFPNLNKNNYFGYAVLLGNEWIQIGAPRGTTPGLEDKETGVAYFCKFNSSCQQLSLGNHISKNTFYLTKKSWFGSSITLINLKERSEKQIVVCAHRWMNESYENVIPGACISFLSNQDPRNISNIIKPTASTERSFRLFLDKDKPIGYRFALSQAGMSVHSPEGKSGELLLGAPGSLQWRGTVVSCKDLVKCSSKPNIVETSYAKTNLDAYNLFGYSVSSGRFFSSELYYVAGAPRDSYSMTGFVLIFQIDGRSEMHNYREIFGEYTGEYFGSSLAVADINGNGLDDLIVGAPFFSQNGDEGRICIIQFYKGKGEEKTCLEGKKENGRFGTSLAAIGDVDKDGYQDIAVGAPFEGNGAVYIYYGGFSGLKRFQRIVAEEIHSDLKGFGISLSGQADIDKNRYNDLAIGSYTSGHVVLLRSRAVVKLVARLKSDVKQLLPRDTQVNITLCVQYKGVGAPDKLNVTKRITADISNKRVNPNYKEETSVIQLGKENCESHIFKVSFRADLILHNVIFHLESVITDTGLPQQVLMVKDDGSIEGTDNFHLQNPFEKLDERLSSEDRLEISFSYNCKTPICKPNLKLNCYISENGGLFQRNQTFISGSTAKYQLIIEVTNDGEPAYVSQAEVKLPDEINLSHTPDTCSEIQEDSKERRGKTIKNDVVCQLGVIIQRGKKSLYLKLDMLGTENLNFTSKYRLDIGVNISTKYAQDTNLADNYQQIPLNVMFDVDGYAHGKSEEDIYPVIKQENGSFPSFLEIIHTHEVHKKGISSMKNMIFTLHVPVEIRHKNEMIRFALLQTPEGVIDNRKWKCSDESPYIHSSDNQSLLPADYKVAPPSNRTLYINCSADYVKCITFTCQPTELLYYGKVTLKLAVNVGKLEPAMGQKDIIFITSEGSIRSFFPHITNTNNLQQNWSHVSSASSIIIGTIPKKKVALWVLVSSVVGGILLVMFVAMGLAKAGFFQRKKREDLQELKEKTRNSQLQPEVNTTADQDDMDDAMELN